MQLYGVNGTNLMEDKLKELDIPFLYVADYLEESPLGKAESLLTLSEVIRKRVGCQTISNYLFVLMNSPPMLQIGGGLLKKTPYTFMTFSLLIFNQ